MYKLIGLTLLVAMVPALTTIEPTTTTGGRIWKCESEYSKYTDTECKKKTNITGCYYLDGFKQYRSCAATCNDVKEHSRDEDRCNADCPDYLSHDGSCTRVLEEDTTTTAEICTTPTTTEISTTPTTTHTSTNATTPNTTVTCKCDETTDGSKSYSSSQFNGAVAASFFGGLVLAALVVLAVWIYYKKQGHAADADNADEESPRSPPNDNADEEHQRRPPNDNGNGKPIRLTVRHNRARGVDDANSDETAAIKDQSTITEI